MAYTFTRMFSPKLASPGDLFFNVIKGAPAVISGKAKTVSGITTSGNTITFTLSSPVASFLYRMTLPFACPVPLGTPDKPFENGTLLNVDLQGATDQEPLSILACVVHVTEREPGRWALGCNFIRELTGAELQALR